MSSTARPCAGCNTPSTSSSPAVRYQRAPVRGVIPAAWTWCVAQAAADGSASNGSSRSVCAPANGPKPALGRCPVATCCAALQRAPFKPPRLGGTRVDPFSLNRTGPAVHRVVLSCRTSGGTRGARTRRCTTASPCAAGEARRLPSRRSGWRRPQLRCIARSGWMVRVTSHALHCVARRLCVFVRRAYAPIQ
jgi:hypothetical protein